MHNVNTCSSLAGAATPGRRQRLSGGAATISPSRTSLSRGASPAMATVSGGERRRSASPSTHPGSRHGGGAALADDTSTVVSLGRARPSFSHVGSAASATGVASSLGHFVNDGRRFEPHGYDTTFEFRGQYQHMALAQSTATLWCANASSGTIDLYSGVTGKFVAALAPLHEAVAARQAELAELPINAAPTRDHNGGAGVKKRVPGTSQLSRGSSPGRTPRCRRSSTTSITAMTSGRVLPASSSSNVHPLASYTFPARQRPLSSLAPIPGPDVRASAMTANSTHTWIGYSDGSVAVYDALTLTLITVGQFHRAPIVALTVLPRGKMVSASADGLLVLWDDESSDFEAISKVTALQDAVREGAGVMCAMTALPPGATSVCCGFESGAVYSLVLASRPQVQTSPVLLCAHQGAVHAMAVVHDTLFTAAEDYTVCAWYCGGGGRGGSTDLFHSPESGDGRDALLSSLAPTSAPRSPRAGHSRSTMKLLKRIPVKPCVRGLLGEPLTRSVWVAYTDGLLERWSANLDDDYGVEEVVDNGLVRLRADTSAVPGTGNRVRALLSLGAVQTIQWLALSSNGVNKTWYGHRNGLEIDLARSTSALSHVIEQDAEDAAAWRERVSVLQQKELERVEKYINILEQLNEQRVLLRHYDRWRRAVLFCGARRKRLDAVAEVLEKKSTVQLTRIFFGKWAFFYDAQQRHLRRYVLSMALCRTTEQLQLSCFFTRWQSMVVRRTVLRGARRCARAMTRMVSRGLLACYFHHWRAVSSSAERRRVSCISAEQLELLASKAQRQVMQRVFASWVAHQQSERRRPRRGHTRSGEALSTTQTPSALLRFVAHYAELQQQRRGREVFALWRRWTHRRTRHASLAAVAALRARQFLYETRQRFFLQWRQRVHARHTRENTEQLKLLERELRRAEAEHGDIFEKLQLQKQLDVLLQQQATEEAHLASIKAQLQSTEVTCSDLRSRQQQSSNVATRAYSEGSGGTATTTTMLPSAPATGGFAEASGGRISDSSVRFSAAWPTIADTDYAHSPSSHSVSLHRSHHTQTTLTSQTQPPPYLLSSTSRGHMATNAAWYRSVVDQQRLSPIVLAHMPLEEAVQHMMGQLKGNVVNLYTDLALFRQIKDRRRAGTAAVGLLLEAFGELKRLVVTTVRGASANAASTAAVRMGCKATRWPLSMEALDCIPVHHCATVLSSVKTLVVAYDLLLPDDLLSVQSTCEELVANADWVFLIARACYLRRKPAPPLNNRQVISA